MKEAEIIEIADQCFDVYKHNLSDHGDYVLAEGRSQYEIMRDKLIDLVIGFSPTSFSVSVTKDPSIHFFIRFGKQGSLGVENFIDVTNGNYIVANVLKRGKQYLAYDGTLEDLLPMINEAIKTMIEDVSICE